MKIIAECGCNWTSIKEARQFIREGKKLGLFAIKFQLFSKQMAKDVKIPEYLSLSKLEAMELYEYGHTIGQEVFFTPMDVERVEWINELSIHYVKVRHKDNLNRELFKAIKKTKQFTFISINEYNDLWQNFVDYKRGAFLYCVPKYPATYEDYLPDPSDISGLNHFNGVSDHTPDCKLLKDIMNDFTDSFYFEKHVCLTKDCLEADWSVTFEELKEALQ